jgi:hypothetical protein
MIISIGGLLGMGTKYVVVPWTSLEVNDKRMMLHGAITGSLKSLLEFKYRTRETLPCQELASIQGGTISVVEELSE